jgi:hypothetical protein
MANGSDDDIEILNHVNERRLQRFTWTAICQSLSCNTKWLQRRSKHDFVGPRQSVNQAELDQLIEWYT